MIPQDTHHQTGSLLFDGLSPIDLTESLERLSHIAITTCRIYARADLAGDKRRRRRACWRRLHSICRLCPSALPGKSMGDEVVPGSISAQVSAWRRVAGRFGILETLS
jgi:hypothetical protein